MQERVYNGRMNAFSWTARACAAVSPDVVSSIQGAMLDQILWKAAERALSMRFVAPGGAAVSTIELSRVGDLVLDLDLLTRHEEGVVQQIRIYDDPEYPGIGMLEIALGAASVVSASFRGIRGGINRRISMTTEASVPAA
jgi:hypothetical protein